MRQLTKVGRRLSELPRVPQIVAQWDGRITSSKRYNLSIKRTGPTLSRAPNLDRASHSHASAIASFRIWGLRTVGHATENAQVAVRHCFCAACVCGAREAARRWGASLLREVCVALARTRVRRGE